MKQFYQVTVLIEAESVREAFHDVITAAYQYDYNGSGPFSGAKIKELNNHPVTQIEKAKVDKPEVGEK